MTPALSTFEVDPPGPANGTVIWMHGLGATNHDFDDVVPMLAALSLRFVFPAAPHLPVTINGGVRMPAWYDILSFDDPPLREDERSVRQSAATVKALIEQEIARGVPANKIVLMGFSQGAAMALHVGSRFESALAGIGVLSGYLLLPAAFQEERSRANALTPILFCHGAVDPVVKFELGQRSYDAVRKAGASAEFHSFPMPHSLCLEEIEVLASWLQKVLAPNSGSSEHA
ncbi:MAG: hypothetical protein RJA70_2625 [Pseudomonadota bacterium]|jgi:phospholipase/carboxylesterase